MSIRGVIHGGRERVEKFAWWAALLGVLSAFPATVAVWRFAPGGREVAILLVAFGGLFLAGWFACRRRKARASSVIAFLLGSLFYGCAVAVVVRAFVGYAGPLW